jgi:glycerol-3-phosphate cytidylyltransferase
MSYLSFPYLNASKLSERIEIVGSVRCVDMVHAATSNDKIEIWKDLRFNLLFKGDDWRGTEKGKRLERDFAALGVELVYFPYTQATSSSALRRTLQNIDGTANRFFEAAGRPELARAA